jgi:hypothetical protein
MTIMLPAIRVTWDLAMQDERGTWLVCCIKGCGDKPNTGGLCLNHHRRMVKYGSPVALRNANWRWLRLSFEERFWLNVRKGEGDTACWLWFASRDKNGYGVFRGEHDGVVYKRAHRYSYALHKGKIPLGLEILHSCDTPECVRPDHLSPGTTLQNQREKWARGRANIPFGEQKSAALTDDTVTAILNDPRPHAVIAAEYGVAASTVGSIKQRVSWQHLGLEKGVKAPRISPRRGKSDKGVTPEIVRAIRASGERGVDLAARYGLTKQDITDIRKRRSWAHVE